MKKVRDIELNGSESVNNLVRQMSNSGGFMAKNFGEAVEILEDMTKDASCVKFLSFPAAPISTGMRGVIRKLVQDSLVDVVITASGTLDHDLARVWGTYYEGDFELNDEYLLKKNIHRLGNVLVPRDSYGTLLEEVLQPFFEEIYSEGIREISSSELSARLGSLSNSNSSILYWANRNNIPVFVPGLTDGAVGSQLWLFSQKHRDFKIDLLKDEAHLSDIVFDAKRSGALMIGGGISKHHTLWWNQFKGGLDFAVNITSAVEWDGSLSGAAVREAVSWGKVKPKARKVTVRGEATTMLPFIVEALLNRLNKS
ncbi:MAG: deoxyhypusine synthase [Nitrososphaerales archaeon]|jgi:deoxyhypusine synthase|nr:deoxyhypusine synthase [Nitrososphaerales archaeon]HJN58193.1 deoxyhypusine synthase [Nitrososphaerales archaeon]|tara:strand:- start:1046 stop:1981 length:936 start_codon:yes stop_codon:yes gene_type:complete